MDSYKFISEICENQASPERAKAMKAYMKNQFDFFGISSPARKIIVKEFKSKHKIKCDKQFWELIDLLWADSHREMQYIALDLLGPLAKNMNCDHLPTLENMILDKSWWDTVDGIVPNIIGDIFKRIPSCRDEYVYKWMESNNIWLQRAVIIFQLKYGNTTDWNLMCEVILKNDSSREFFVRKGQGWALRQYSKYQPLLVRQFVESNPQLSGLTKREALRNIM